MKDAAQSFSPVALKSCEKFRKCITAMQHDREVALKGQVEMLNQRIALDVERGTFVIRIEPGFSNGDKLLRLQQLAHERELGRICDGLFRGVNARRGVYKPWFGLGQGKGLAGRLGVHGDSDATHQPGLPGSIQHF